MTYFDMYGGLHHRDDIPDPNNPKYADKETSENAPMYTGIWITLRFANDRLNKFQCEEFLDYIGSICKFDNLKGKWVWRTTPWSDSKRFSRDNWQGVFSGILSVERLARERMHLGDMSWHNIAEQCQIYRSRVPLLHKQYAHPRTFMLAWKFTHGTPGLFLVQVTGLLIITGIGYGLMELCPWKWLDILIVVAFTIAMIVWTWLIELDAMWSCYTTHKERNGNLFWKTDGKLLAYMTTIAFSMGKTFQLCEMAALRERSNPPPYSTFPVAMSMGDGWSWYSWEDIALYYFNGRGDHPIVTELLND